MPDELVIPGDSKVLVVSAAEMPAAEDLDGWDVGQQILATPDRAWLVGRYLHAGMPPNSNGHVFRPDQIEKRHAAIPHSPFDMLHDPSRIVGHYAATKIVRPQQAQAAGYTDTPYVKALACVYSYYFPEDFQAIRDAYEQGLAFMSMSCLPESVTCPTCDHNAPWRGYNSPLYCSHMQGRNPKWMENPVFLGGAAIIPPTRPGWKNAAVTRIAGFVDANQSVAADIFDKLHELAPAAAQLDLEVMTAQLLAIAYGKTATDVDHTVQVAPLWAKLTAEHPGVDFQPTAAVAAAVDPVAASDACKVRAVSLAERDLITPTGVRSLVAELGGEALAAEDRAALGGDVTLAWAQSVITAMDNPDFSGSGMLALYPSEAEQLVVPGGQPADEMHVTIAYLGNTDEVEPQAFEVAGTFGLAVLSARPVIEASVSGAGTLGTEGAVVLFLQGEGLDDAYDETWEVLDASGQQYHERHPSFIAHCTLGYGATEDETTALVLAGSKLAGTTVILDKAGYDAPGDGPVEMLPLGSSSWGDP